MKFLFTSFCLVAAASLGFANKLPTLTVPPLPKGIPSPDPITLISELSPQCQGAFLSIVANPEFFQCVPVGALLPVLIDPTFLPDVLKDPLGSGPKLLPIVEAICADPKCSDKSVSEAQKAVAEGCSSGSDAKNPIVQLASAVLEFYSPVRDIICFKDHSNDFCLVDTITTVLTLPSPPPPFKLLGGIIDKLIGAEPSKLCTPCDKAIANTLIDFFAKDPHAIDVLEGAFHIGEEELKIGEFYFVVKCGFEFLDGKIPDTTIDPKKFTYQVKDGDESSASRQREIGLAVVGLLASGFMLN